METTIFVAKILGVYLTVSGIFIVTHKRTLALMLKDFFEHRAITFLAGVILLACGTALVLRKDTGTDGLSTFMTIISWMILIKGIIYIFAPEWLREMTRNIPRSLFSAIGVITAVLGLYILFMV